MLLNIALAAFNIDHIIHYKDLVELHGYVPVKSASGSDELETKIEYKVTTQIEWAERMAQYWKRKGGTKISVMDFNSMTGRSKRMRRDVPLFSQGLDSKRESEDQKK